MDLVLSGENSDIMLVKVKSGEFRCDGGKLLPYATTIGTISRSTYKINVWIPSASKPRGYRTAAKRKLEEIAEGMKRNE